jgi:hypothetical protein
MKLKNVLMDLSFGQLTATLSLSIYEKRDLILRQPAVGDSWLYFLTATFNLAEKMPPAIAWDSANIVGSAI